MPINPNTGLYERDAPSIFAPGMFSGPLEAMNATRATSLANEADNRRQLEDYVLQLSANAQQQKIQKEAYEQDLRQSYIRGMQGIDSPVAPPGPEPDEQGPGFGYAGQQDIGPYREPSQQDLLQRAQVQAMKYGQPGAYQFANASTNLGYKGGMLDVAQQNAATKALAVDDRAKYLEIKGRLDDSHAKYFDERRKGLELVRTSGALLRSYNAKSGAQEAAAALASARTAVDKAYAAGWRNPAQIQQARMDLVRARAAAAKIRKDIKPDDDDATKKANEEEAAAIDAEVAASEDYIDTNKNLMPNTDMAAPQAAAAPSVPPTITPGGQKMSPVSGGSARTATNPLGIPGIE